MSRTRHIRAAVRTGLGLALLVAAHLLAPAESSALAGGIVSGRVTYVSGEVYYISLGSKEGMEDSLTVTVISRGDSIATLKVFAVSSKSSACRMVSGKRAPAVGDAVSVTVEATSATPLPVAADAGARNDSVAPAQPVPGIAAEPPPTDASASARRSPQQPPAIRVGGRLTAVYQTYVTDAASGTITRPSLSAAMRGELRDVPVRLEFAGSLSSSVTGTSAPFAGGSVNRSRIYRLYAVYDDDVNRFGVGRLLPAVGLPSGYLDGVVLGRRAGMIEIGIAAGYEPDFRKTSFSTERRKVLVFVGTGNRGADGWSGNIGFSRTFLGSSPERSVASATAFFSPSPVFSLNGQTEIDFLNLKDSRRITRPKLSSLLARMDYRISGSVTFGIGVTAWRPVYPLSTLEGIADSLVDTRLWVSPTATIRVASPAGISLQESYSPRSTPEGFGKEYFNSVSVGLYNALGSGVAVRASQTLNRSSIASTTGYGGSLRRSVWQGVDAGVSYQYYRYAFNGRDDASLSRSVTTDLSFPVGPALFVMVSGEFARVTSGKYTLVTGSLSWRF